MVIFHHKTNRRLEKPMNIEEILKIMPHRYPFLLVDKIAQFEAHKSALGIKNVTINEPFFMGHFPTKPVMPGVLIIESMAQVACILALKSLQLNSLEDKLVYFMSIESAKFRKIVQPGDILHLDIQVQQQRGNIWKFQGKAFLSDTQDICSEALFTAMVK